MNLDRVLVVFTAKSVQQIFALGGTQSWVLNPKSMRGVKYAVCTRNTDPRWDEECGPRPEAHNAAFIVGKVAGLKKVDRDHDRDRYLVQFSEYALVEVAEFRSGSTRNPVTYSDADQCKQNGLDIETLNFRPMPPLTEEAIETVPATSTKKGLSMGEAKEGLSLFFGVPVESVQITISG